ncbi:hypothetical protein PIB30_072648 [Stylosanthes scabra]|uniref:Uncharacterized protein n=1 Tax=Stylosanthes scabra TaxID=79078 RepID=A0ABU6XM16_9FABA|nr:hypothetical protein [Stylosanthes scabra]
MPWYQPLLDYAHQPLGNVLLLMELSLLMGILSTQGAVAELVFHEREHHGEGPSNPEAMSQPKGHHLVTECLWDPEAYAPRTRTDLYMQATTNQCTPGMHVNVWGGNDSNLTPLVPAVLPQMIPIRMLIGPPLILSPGRQVKKPIQVNWVQWELPAHYQTVSSHYPHGDI